MVELDLEEAYELQEAEQHPDVVFPKGTTVRPLYGPIRKGRVRNQEGLKAKKHIEHGAKRQKVIQGAKVWRSLNSVYLEGGRTEGQFVGGCLFQIEEQIDRSKAHIVTQAPEVIKVIVQEKPQSSIAKAPESPYWNDQ